jgi:transcriptional regulator with XRE-family HTH domain
MASIREILANNLKEFRRINGFSQDKLAELADISSQYLATVETCRKFPTPEVLERLAAALDVETQLLFSVSPSPEEAMEKLHQSIVKDIDSVVANAVKKAIAENL